MLLLSLIKDPFELVNVSRPAYLSIIPIIQELLQAHQQTKNPTVYLAMSIVARHSTFSTSWTVNNEMLGRSFP